MVVVAGVEAVPGVAPISTPRASDLNAGELIAAGTDRTEIHSRGTASREQGDIMLKARRDAAMKVAQSLFAAEDAIDSALARAAELSAAIVTARSDANLSAMVGHDAFEMAASAFAALARARCDIIESHKRLDEAKTQIGLRVMSVGELGKPPSINGLQNSSHLQAVA